MMKSKNLKINIAMLICTMFIFRVLIINIGLISAHSSTANSYTSVVLKRHQHVDIASKKCEYPLIDIFEESNDDDDKFKFKLFYTKLLSLNDESGLMITSNINPHYQTFLITSTPKFIRNRVFRI